MASIAIAATKERMPITNRTVDAVCPAFRCGLPAAASRSRWNQLPINSASGGRQEILAVARAHALTDGRAEFALLVRSDLKGLGIGSVLLDRLIARSRSRGISLLVADVLQENTRMLRLADKYGFHQEAAQLGTTRLVLDLDSLAA